MIKVDSLGVIFRYLHRVCIQKLFNLHQLFCLHIHALSVVIVELSLRLILLILRFLSCLLTLLDRFIIKPPPYSARILRQFDLEIYDARDLLACLRLVCAPTHAFSLADHPS
jgi:hypothetical protein